MSKMTQKLDQELLIQQQQPEPVEYKTVKNKTGVVEQKKKLTRMILNTKDKIFIS